MNNVYKILVGKPGYKALFGHTSSRRKGHFKTRIQDLGWGCVNWN